MGSISANDIQKGLSAAIETGVAQFPQEWANMVYDGVIPKVVADRERVPSGAGYPLTVSDEHCIITFANQIVNLVHTAQRNLAAGKPRDSATTAAAPPP